jgi:rare lipoprotein A
MIKRLVPVICRPLFLSCLLLLFFFGCARVTPPTTPPPKAPKHTKPYKVGKKWYQPLPHAKGFTQRGLASWYGKKFHGRKTSNGEIYDMYAMTAAHKTLPFETYIMVHNLKNGKKINVRINDRGPFVRGRIVDLSYAAARKLGIFATGTAPVEIVALGSAGQSKSNGGSDGTAQPVDYYRGNFTIQVGAFSEKDNAEKLRRNLDQLYKNAHITARSDGYETLYRVRVGRSSTLEQAAKCEEIMIRTGFVDAFVVAEDD